MSLGLNFGLYIDSVVLLAAAFTVVVGEICLLTAHTLLQVSMLTDVMLSLDILGALTLPLSVVLALARSLLLRDVSIALDVTNIRVRDSMFADVSSNSTGVNGQGLLLTEGLGRMCRCRWCLRNVDLSLLLVNVALVHALSKQLLLHIFHAGSIRAYLLLFHHCVLVFQR